MALFVGALSFAVRSVGGVVFAVWSFQRHVFCGSILSEACLLRFGPLGASSFRFDPFGGVSLRFGLLGVSSLRFDPFGGVVFCGSVRWRRRLCGSILLEACLLRFGPLGCRLCGSICWGRRLCGLVLSEACLLRFDPFGGVSFVVRSVGGVVFAVRSFWRRVFCGSVRWGRFHSKDEIEHQAVLARNTERTVLMVLK
jgi:hypothetical protein